MMPPLLHRLCRERMEYYRTFEREAAAGKYKCWPYRRGLGDWVAAMIRSRLGIRKKRGCGCGQRQDKLNELFPYSQEPKGE